MEEKVQRLEEEQYVGLGVQDKYKHIIIIADMRKAVEIATYGKTRKSPDDKNENSGLSTDSNKRKSKGTRNSNPVSWWDQDCEYAIQERKRQLRKFRSTKSMEDFIEFKRFRAIAKKVIKQKKREDLHRFASLILLYFVPHIFYVDFFNIKYVWNKIKVLKKGWSTIEWHKWQTKDREKEIEKMIEKVAPPWVNNQRNTRLNESIRNEENLNGVLTKEEFDRALKYTKKTSAPGRDGIEYTMLKL